MTESLKRIYEIVTYLDYFCAIASVFVCIYFVRTVYRSQLVHRNLKIILCCYSISASQIGYWRVMVELSQNLSFENKIMCIGFGFISAFCTGFVQLCILAILLERYFATYQASSYEKNDRSYIINFGLPFMCIYAAAFAIFVCVYDQFFLSKTGYPIWPEMCISLYRRPWLMVSGWLVYAAVTLPSIPPCFYLSWYNARLLRQANNRSLSTRYQYKENIAMLRSISVSLLILNIAFGGAGLLAVTYLIYAMLHHWPVETNVYLAIRITNIIISSGSGCHSLIVLAFHPSLGKQVRSICQLAQFWRYKTSVSSLSEPISRVVIANQDTQIYFKDLNDAWNKI